MRRCKWIACSLLILATLTGRSIPTSSVFAADPEPYALIETYLNDYMRLHRIPGMALGIVEDNSIVYVKGYGQAGPGGQPVTPQTPFVIGSITKSLTAVAVMQLVEQGHIDLDEPVQVVLPWFTLRDTTLSSQITIRHLLHHTSGISLRVGDKDLVNPDVSDEALERNIRELRNYPLAHPPGQVFEYSNSNYEILGLIVQTVSGLSYETYVEEHIFAPLAMEHSHTSLPPAQHDGLAVGHQYWFGYPLPAAHVPYARSKLPAGFLISSAEDMSQYLIMHLNGGQYSDQQILLSASMAAIHQPAVVENAAFSYGMGWHVTEVDGAIVYLHGGDTASYHANIVLVPERDLGVVLLMNVNGILQDHVLNEPINEVLRLLTGHNTGRHSPNLAGFVLGLVTVIVVWTAGYSLFMIGRFRIMLQHPEQIRPLWHILLPTLIDAVQIWIILIGLPKLFDTYFSVMLVFVPDLSILLLISVVALLSWNVIRLMLATQVRLAHGLPGSHKTETESQ